MSVSGTACTTGLLLIFVLCSFTCVAVGRVVATGDEVIARVQSSGGADGAVGVQDEGSRTIVDGARSDESTRRSDHSEVGLCVARQGLSRPLLSLLQNGVYDHEFPVLV